MRATDARTAMLLEQGLARSTTFRRLVETLEGSDVIVWVRTAFLPRPSVLHFVGVSPKARFLRISMNCGRMTAEGLVPWLGHELQHAVEVALAPEVTSAAALGEYYRRRGESASSGTFCTWAAQRATLAVEYEIGRTKMRRASGPAARAAGLEGQR